MGSQDIRPTDPPQAARAAGLAVAFLIALAAIYFLSALHLLGMVSLLRESRSLQWIGGGVELGAMCTYLFWLYRRHKSLPWVDAVPSEGSGLVVVWHFVPLVNFVKPYLTLSEMWDATAPEETTPPRLRGPVFYFWATLVGAAVLLIVAGRPSESMDAAADSYFLTLSRLVFAVSFIFGAAMILAIEARWKARYVIVSHRHDAPLEEASPALAATPESAGFPPQGEVPARAFPLPPAAPPAVARPPISVPSSVSARDASAVPHLPAPASTPRVPAATPAPAASRDAGAAPFRPAPPSPATMNVLAKLRGAGMAASILAVFTALYILMLFTTGLRQMTTVISGNAFGEGLARTIVLLYVAIGAFAAIPAIHLWRFSRSAIQFAGDPTESNLHDVLRFQGRYWAFIGGLVAFVLIMQIALIGLAILIPTLVALIS
ncbi:MAG: DUF4328 domain-containing protein [Thermoanaerobaculia bacterium]